MYRRKFRNNIKNKFIKNGAEIDIFIDLIKRVIEINNKFYKQAVEKRYNKKRFKKTGIYTENNFK